MNVPETLLNQALQLPKEARAALAHELLMSLEPEEPEPGYEAAWQAEIEARLAKVDAGEAELCDWRESMAHIRQAFQEGKTDVD